MSLNKVKDLDSMDFMMVTLNALSAAKVGDLETLKKLTLNDKLTDNKGASLLHYAARSGSLPVIGYLIEDCHFSVFLRTKTGSTAIHDAAARGNTAVVKWFLDHSNLQVDDQDAGGITCIHLASRYGHFLTVEVGLFYIIILLYKFFRKD